MSASSADSQDLESPGTFAAAKIREDAQGSVVFTWMEGC